jgi:hypothetical protein
MRTTAVLHALARPLCRADRLTSLALSLVISSLSSDTRRFCAPKELARVLLVGY